MASMMDSNLGAAPIVMEREDASWLRATGGGRFVPIPGYIAFMAAVTCLYLVVELAFNARLLDVTGGDATHEEVLSIERWGRLISGLAVTLAVWGAFLLPRMDRGGWSLPRQAAALAGAAAICMFAVFHGEKSIIDTIVDRSTGEERRSATWLAAFSSAVVDGGARIEGLDLGPRELASPEGKSFVALFPFVAASTPNLEAKATDALRDVVRNRVESRIGTAPQAFNRIFRPSAEAMIASYNEYADGTQRLRRALEGAGNEADRAWDDYVRELRNRGLSPQRVPPARWGEVASNLRRKRIEVPNGWNPADRHTFDRAVLNRVNREARARFESETSGRIGVAIPPGLSLAQFIAVPHVQIRWRDEIEAPAGAALDPGMSPEQYGRAVHEPTVRRLVDEEVRALLLPATAYADNGSQGEKGRRAMEALVVPPFALALSLLGALFHIWKAARYTSRLIWRQRLPEAVYVAAHDPNDWLLYPAQRAAESPQVAGRAERRLKVREYGMLGVVALIATCAFLAPNRISSSAVFGYFEARTAETMGTSAALATRWVVQAQPYFYPANEFIRQHLLFGLSFGYADRGGQSD